MATAVQKQRLIDGLAYIYSHQDHWFQGTWRTFTPNRDFNICGTFGCLAGHLALTLDPAKPAVSVPSSVWKKPASQRTAEERALIDEAEIWIEYVVARADDNPDIVRTRNVRGVDTKVVYLADRARQLIGGLRVTEDGNRDLFDGNNEWPQMLSIGAELLEMSEDTLMEKIEDSIKAHEWDKKLKTEKAAASST